MTWVHAVWQRIKLLGRRSALNRGLDEEICFHIEQQTEKNRRAGMSPDDARRQAMVTFGGVERVKEHTRDEFRAALLEDSTRDILYGTRALWRAPGFTVMSALTIALGIGSIATVFSVVHAVVLRPLPFDRPDQLVRLVETVPPEISPTGAARRRITDSLSVGELYEIRHRARAVSFVAAYVNAYMTLTDTAQTARLEGWRVEPDLFPMLGVQPLYGRVFATNEAAPGADGVIIVGHAAWQRHLGGRPDVIGRTLTLDNRRYTVIGVMPPEFEFPVEFASRDFWLPLVLDVSTAQARNVRLPTAARLATGVSIEQAAAEVGSLLRAMNGKASAYEFVRVHDEWVAPIRAALRALAVAVVLVFLIAAVNVSSLLLARTATRQREMAIRTALGGGRARLVRLLLTESVLVALMGSAAGIALAFVSVRMLRTLAATMPRMDLGMLTAFPRLGEIVIDLPVLSFTVGVALLTGIVCGVAPAVRYTRPGDAELLRQAVSSTASGANRWYGSARDVLVAAQVALATTLLVGAGLLAQSLLTLSRADVGYEPEGVVTFQVALPAGKYKGPTLEGFAETLVEDLARVEGVTAAAYTPLLPMVTLLEHSASFRRVPGPPTGQSPPDDDLRGVSHNYFKVMGIDVLAGRGLSADDRAGRPRVVVINRAMARRHFPGKDPIGKTAYLQRLTEPWEIVGVVDDVRQMGPAQDPKPQAFVDSRQWPGMAPGFRFLQYYAVRVNTQVDVVTPRIRDVVRGLDPDAAVYNLAPMGALLDNSVSRPRFYAALGAAFSGIALLIAAAGLYGTVAYFVAARTREIGIRVALGARREQVMRLVLYRSAIVTGVGMVLGGVGALLLTRYLEGLLFGLSPLDPATFVAVTLLFGTVAAIATFVPAKRVLSVDPLVALRHE
jgi:putative ABC transport system permease protein